MPSISEPLLFFKCAGECHCHQLFFPLFSDRLMNEVMEVVGNIEEVTADHIDNLNFMEQVR